MVPPFIRTGSLRPEFLNTSFPIFVTLSGIMIEVKAEQSPNAPSSIFVTLSGIVIDVKAEQSLNIPSSIFVTLSGIVIDVKAEHSKNAPFIEVTVSGMV